MQVSCIPIYLPAEAKPSSGTGMCVKGNCAVGISHLEVIIISTQICMVSLCIFTVISGGSGGYSMLQVQSQ